MKAILALAILFACTAASAQTASSPPGSVLSASGGRFVFGQISEYRRDQYLLDTHTGRVWQVACQKKDENTKQCELSVLSPMLFEHVSGKFGYEPDVVPAKK